jgi:hypothetical protein
LAAAADDDDDTPTTTITAAARGGRQPTRLFPLMVAAKGENRGGGHFYVALIQ